MNPAHCTRLLIVEAITDQTKREVSDAFQNHALDLRLEPGFHLANVMTETDGRMLILESTWLSLDAALKYHSARIYRNLIRDINHALVGSPVTKIFGSTSVEPRFSNARHFDLATPAGETGLQTLGRLQKSYGMFCRPDDVTSLARDPQTRLQPLLVRCSGGRFTAPAQDVNHFIALVESGRNENGAMPDFVRDVSIPASDRATARLDLINEILYPGGDREHSWSPDTLNAIAEVINAR